MKVLYADDDVQVRDYVSMLLEAGLDCEILEASSGNEALSILEFDSEVDFVITEVQMKGGGGNLIVDFLDHHKLNIPIVWLSDPVNKEVMLVQEVLARSPLNAFVGKPFRDDEFFPIIDNILNLKAEQTTANHSQQNEEANKDEGAEVEFDDSDFDLSDVAEDISSGTKSTGKGKGRDSDDDWSYGFTPKEKGEESVLDYGHKKKQSSGEEEAGYSLKKEFSSGEEEEAGYSLKKEFSSSEEEAGYSLKKEFSSSEEEAGYSLKKEFSSGEEEEGYSLKKEFSSSEEEAGYSLKKEFFSSEDEAGYSLKKEFSSGEEEALDYSNESKESRVKAKKTSIVGDQMNENDKDGKDDKDNEDDYDKTRFKRVKLKRFLNFNEICCDVYIKINLKKYLKVINSGEEYAQDMISKYSEKGIAFLFVENEQYPHFSEQFGNLVMDRLEKSKNLSSDIKAVAELAALENTMESAKELGVTPVTAKKVRNSVKANIESLSKMPKLDSLLDRMMRGGDYLSEHSLLLSYVAGQICMATSWGNAQTLEKLSMAAIFHDIALDKNEWGRFHTLEQAKEAGLSDSEIQKVKDHPGAAAKLISEGENIFADVDSIIMQHHELPDKSGFPRGLGALSISPLSCIFIIASELVEEIYGKSPASIDLEKIKAKFSDIFNKGNFKKPLAAFLKVF